MSIEHIDCLRLEGDVREDARQRLLSLKGHVEGILRMLENDRTYCVDVLKQVKAVEGALVRVGDLVFRSHLKTHVVTSVQRGDSDALIEELMEYLKYRR